MTWIEFAGWLPAVILPLSTFLQFREALTAEDVVGISPAAWALFAVANIGAYIYTGKPLAAQAIFAFLLPAILDIGIVTTVFVRRRRR